MDYLSINPDEREGMLEAIGVSRFEELLGCIPASVRLNDKLDIEGGLSELEVSRHVRALADKNQSCTTLVSFAGAGCYDHYIPSFIDHILRRPEFFTAYTPYQPEVSQGTLRAIYEYQTAICALTGMQVANASMYDGATALAEAALMSIRASRGKKTEILVSDEINPQWIEVLETYAAADIMTIRVVTTDDLIAEITPDTAGIAVGYPDFYGTITDIAPLIGEAHEKGVLAIVAAQPMMLSLLESPGSLGADIVVGEAQCFANPQSFGGPGLGFFGSTDKLMRNMPGRIVGRTTDVEGNEGYVLTLSTREQHIRREKATSNICSNHALNALAAGAYLMYMGGDGLKALANECVEKAHALCEKLEATGLFERVSDGEFGYEFALRYTNAGSAEELHGALFERGFIPGVLIDDDTFLFAVTEKRTADEIESFVKAVKDVAC